MKKIILGIGIIAALASCGSDETKSDISTQLVNNSLSKLENYEKKTGGPAFQFVEETYNFGEIVQGQSVEYSYQFVNSGDEPLVIVSVKGSCGCTVPVSPEAPIAPGEKSMIKVTFNSAGKRGHQDKRVTIKSNAKGEQSVLVLHIVGEVSVPENKQ
jgi:hypothetical protein